MKERFVLLVVLAILALPALAFSQKVDTDFDSTADFSKFKTYAWTKGTPAPNEFGEQRIHDIVEKAMAAKGFTKVDVNPDAVIATHAVAQEQRELTASGYGGGLRFGGGGTARVETFVQGTLAVDLYDAHTKKLVWRGVGTDTASDKADKNTKEVQKAVDKMFKDYPPKKK